MSEAGIRMVMSSHRNPCRTAVLALWLSFIGSLLCPLTHAGERPELPAPKGATVKRVGDSIQTNGLTMSIREFHTNDDMEEVKAFYARTFPPGKDDPGMYLSTAAEPWTVLSRMQEPWLMTVQMQATDMGGTWGYLGIARVPEPGEPEARPEPPRSLHGTVLISSSRSEDDGQSGEVFLMNNDYSVRSNLEFYKGLYSAWRADMEQPVMDGAGYALSFSRGSKRVNMTIVAGDKGSYITINVIRRSLL
ncbi:MAG: hypothetical protein KDK91_32045 [Gammaproteobacteria bacterium]|nr:hypothetical protein [Gammaproteobacteria bacterium]